MKRPVSPLHQAFKAAALLGCFTFLSARGISAAESTTQPTASPSAPAIQPLADGARTLSQISTDLIQVSAEIRAAGGSPEVLSDAMKRAEAAPKLIPLVRKQNALLDEYIIVAGSSLPPSSLDQMKQHNTAMLYLLRDQATVDQIDKTAQGEVSNATLEAFSTRLMSQWIAAGKDEDAQIKLVDQIEKVDVAHPDNVQMTMFTFSLSRDAASDELQDRLMSIAADKMNNKVSTSLKKRVALIQRARADGEVAKKQLASLENKPLVVAGKTPEGNDFTTADWKGKVILVDFWATWCGPCKAELPRVKAMYAKYHDKGFEIVSVSNDYSQSDLTNFTAENNMPWPELFNSAAAATQHWNPTTIGYGIRGIPTMFLIDKKGTCRTVEAREKMEDLVPKLLAE